MSERERPRGPTERPSPEGLGNPFAMGDDAGAAVTIEHGVYTEQLPLAGRTVDEIRRIVATRYDIDPRAHAFVDGHHVGHEVVVRPGQSLRFMHLSGEKGQGGLEQLRDLAMASLLPDARALPRSIPVRSGKPMPKVTIEGDVVSVITPEGRRATMTLDELFAHLDNDRPSEVNTRNLVWPDGIKSVVSRAGHTVLVHQTPPAVHSLRWIAADSPIRHGDGTIYRQVRIALPYVIVFAVFEPRRDGKIRLSDRNECFFATKPLRGPDSPLYYPALLNCSKIGRRNRPLSWICTQHLVHGRLPLNADLSERLRRGLADILHCLFETGFNYSSEAHEITSWFTESTRIDPRIRTIERWEHATRQDPMFVHGVRWIEVGKTVAEITERCLALGAGPERSRTSHDVARILRTRGKVEQPETES